MLDFKVIEIQKPNKDLTNILKDFKYHDERQSEKKQRIKSIRMDKINEQL